MASLHVILVLISLASFSYATSMSDLVLPKGYPLEQYEVETEDGYLLAVFRIAHGLNTTHKGSPILLQHGLLGASTTWVLAAKEQGLPFILADAGYDVWIGNSRGNTFSTKHKYLSPTDDKAKFWDFSFHEMGYYDLAAVVDYILEKTSNEKLQYVGYSQGATQFLVLTSTRPQYNEKVTSAHLLAPMAFLPNARGTAKALGTHSTAISWMTYFFGIYEVLTSNFITRLFGEAVCVRICLTRPLCENLLFLIAGYDSEQFDKTLVPLISEVSPAGTSIKVLLHYGQLMTNSDKFCQYDYGQIENLKIYRSTEPPEYNLTKITVPVSMYYGHNDNLSTDEDVLHLQTVMQTAKAYKVSFDAFNHIDFLWARQVDEILYNDLVCDIIKSDSPVP